MLYSRIIPCLLIKNGSLIKTINFKNEKYVGDPLNAVRIFNEKQVDELIVIDIAATVECKEPDYNLISKIASECRMPLCYTGGICETRTVERLVSLGVEKCGISSAAINSPEILAESVQIVGSQSVVAVIDVKKNEITNRYEIHTHNGLKNTGKDLIQYINEIEKYKVGEVVINSIDRDGTSEGYDIELINLIYNNISCPLTVIGGAGSYSDVSSLINKFKIIGASAGSLFIFKGKFRAVMLNYPDKNQKEEIFNI